MGEENSALDDVVSYFMIETITWSILALSHTILSKAAELLFLFVSLLEMLDFCWSFRRNMNWMTVTAYLAFSTILPFSPSFYNY